MKVTVTTYKESGKWYDDLEINISDEIPCFETNKIEEALELENPSLKEFNYTYCIDDSEQGKWQRRLVIH